MLLEQTLKLIQNGSLKELNLSKLKINDGSDATLIEQKMVLQELLKHSHCKIKTLDVSGIKFDQEGFSIITNLLHTNKSIDNLNLSHTGLTKEIAGELLEVLHQIHSFWLNPPSVLLFP